MGRACGFRRESRFAGWLVLLALFFPLHAWSAEYSGKVIAIADGDTLNILYQGGSLRVRLAEIDAPERDQPYGSRAKQTLSDLCFGKAARVIQQDRDRYGRVVARVFCDSTDANAEMVRRGAAWVYRQYVTDQSLYALEQEAKAAGRGLWALPEAQRMPPWEWRHGGRKNARRSPQGSGEAALTGSKSLRSSQAQCGAKRTCKEMTSCAEARFYLDQCGLVYLDGDRDGVPCEALCR